MADGVDPFSSTVRGNNGVLQTAATGTIETDNYDAGGAIRVRSADYPATVNPAAVIQELIITDVGTEIVVDIDTVGGNSITDVELNGRLLTMDKLSIDSITFRDPSGTGDAVDGLWVGE